MNPLPSYYSPARRVRLATVRAVYAALRVGVSPFPAVMAYRLAIFATSNN